MHVDGVGRVSVVPSLPVLRPEEQVLQLMLDGWRNQQLSRNLQFATIEQRLRCVRRFVEHMNEDPWNWTPAMVEEFSADLRTVRHVSRSTLRSYHSALRAFTSYVSNPDYGWDRVCEQYFGTHPAQVFFDWNSAPHVQEYDGGPTKRPYTRSELDRLFVYADDEVERMGRVERGEVDDTITATGSDELPIGRGDLIQTRRNDPALGVANRQQWIVQHVAGNGTVYARETGSGRRNPRTVALPPEYVSEHAHLSYAATAYGVQGATVNASHTMLTEATSAAGVYVGMTRGREHNWLHVVAEDMAEARAQFVAATERDPADRGLDHATAQAAEAVRGIVKDGPIQRVTEELARLDREAERAERHADRWEQAANRLDAQRAAHRAESDESTAALRQAEEEAARVRAKVAAPLTKQAEQDGATYLARVEAERTASTRLATVGRFGRRKARDEHRAASEQAATIRVHLRDEWDAEPPRTRSALPEWATQVAERRAEADPRVSEANQAVETARTERTTTVDRHRNERLALLASEYGAENARAHQYGMRALNPRRNARDARTRADFLRVESAELRSLPTNVAAKLIETKRAEQERGRQQATERARQLHSPFANDPQRYDPRREGPARGL